MASSERKYVVFLVVLFGLLVAVKVMAPEPLDWRDNFQRDATTPLGSRILYEALPSLFPHRDIRPVDVTAYEMLREVHLQATNYLFVTDTFQPDEAETKVLRAFVQAGNHLFVVAARLEGALADSLGIETRPVVSLPPGVSGGTVQPGLRRGDLGVNFSDPTLRRDSAYVFPTGVVTSYFSKMDTARTTVLGSDDEGRANFIRVDAGTGAVYLSTLPRAFTNAAMLSDGNDAYVYTALSHLPISDVLWDAHDKPLRSATATPLRYVLSQEALRWAYYVLMATALLFIAVRARRRQRAIPIVEPPRNTSLEFTETIGRLYYQHGDHANLVRKKLTYFLEYIRTRLRVATAEMDTPRMHEIAAKAGVPVEDVTAIFATADRLGRAPRISGDDLVRFSNLIEDFYERSRR